MQKQQFTHETIWKFQSEFKLNTKDVKLLLEAFRRKNLITKNSEHIKPNTTQWVGLGLPSEYKSPYFRAHNGTATPRVQNWWVLSEKGVEMMVAMESRFTIPTDLKEADQLNNFLYSYNFGSF